MDSDNDSDSNIDSDTDSDSKLRGTATKMPLRCFIPQLLLLTKSVLVGEVKVRFKQSIY